MQSLTYVDLLAVRDFFILANAEVRPHLVKTDFDLAIEQFVNNPSKESAVILLERYPHLIDIFEAAMEISRPRAN